MDRIVAVAACDFRGRGARGARTLPVVDADFRAGLARADSERRVPCFAYRKHEAGLDFGVAPRDPACFGDRVCLYSAARAKHSRGAARGECAVAGDGPGAGRGSPGRDADPRAIPARARDRLPDDGETGIARDRAVYPPRRDRDWALVRRFVVDGAAESLLNRDPMGSTADGAARPSSSVRAARAARGRAATCQARSKRRISALSTPRSSSACSPEIAAPSPVSSFLPLSATEPRTT